jgi:hypothetical protein
MQDTATEQPDFSGLEEWQGRSVIPYCRGCGETLMAVMNQDQAEADAAPKTKQPPSKRELQAKDQLKEKLGEVPFPLRILIKIGFPVVKFIFRRMTEPKRTKKGEMSEEEREFREGKVDLTVDEVPTPLARDAQRRAWEKLTARGDAVWDEVIQKAVAVYNSQRDVRVQVWKATYPTLPVERRLPAVNDAVAMRPLVVAVGIRIKPPAKQGAADIGVHFACSWCADGFGAIIRDGTVAEVGAFDLVHPMKMRSADALQHPVFGPLRRIPDDDPWEKIEQWKMPTQAGQSGFEGAKSSGPGPWEGSVRCDLLHPFVLAADDRAKYTHDRREADAPKSAMAWDYACGEFELRVHADAAQEPSKEQAESFRAFRAREKEVASAVVRTIFDDYQKNCEARRRDWIDHYVDELCPVLNDYKGLRDIMQLRRINVLPAGADGKCPLAFQFVSTWDSDGFTVTVGNGQVKLGKWDDAKPKSSA